MIPLSSIPSEFAKENLTHPSRISPKGSPEVWVTQAFFSRLMAKSTKELKNIYIGKCIEAFDTIILYGLFKCSDF